LKRAINGVDETATMQDVMGKVEEFAETITAEPCDVENSFSRLASPTCLALRPTDPDDWMLEDGCEIKVPGRRKAVFLPSIKSIIETHESTKSGPNATLRKVRSGNSMFYVMAIARQVPVSAELAKDMVAQVCCKREDELTKLWQANGMLTTPTDVNALAPQKWSLARTREIWGSFCMVRVLKPEGNQRWQSHLHPRKQHVVVSGVVGLPGLGRALGICEAVEAQHGPVSLARRMGPRPW